MPYHGLLKAEIKKSLILTSSAARTEESAAAGLPQSGGPTDGSMLERAPFEKRFCERNRQSKNYVQPQGKGTNQHYGLGTPLSGNAARESAAPFDCPIPQLDMSVITERSVIGNTAAVRHGSCRCGLLKLSENQLLSFSSENKSNRAK